ncbi:MAG: FkbM family methyltransferase [Gemmatimonadota bacterium]
MTKHYPSRKVAQEFNTALGWALFDRPEPRWVVGPAFDVAPAMALNLSNRLLRKMYYFPKAWGRWWMGTPLAQCLQQELTPGSLFVDIGSNVGFFSLYAARLVGSDGAVLAFEPDPELAESLRRSALLNEFDHLDCAPIALSDHTGDGRFYKAVDAPASSLVPEAPERRSRYRDTIRVPVSTLDDYLEGTPHLGRRVGLIKVDVEGEEARAIAGMLETLREACWPTLWVEVRGPHGSTRAPNTYPAVLALLAPLGYRPYRCVEGRELPVAEGEVQGREDILFRHANR